MAEQRGLVTRPGLDEVHAYRSAVDERMLALLRHADDAACAWLVLACDMPAIDRAGLEALVAARTAAGPSAAKSSSPTLSSPTSGATARAMLVEAANPAQKNAFCPAIGGLASHKVASQKCASFCPCFSPFCLPLPHGRMPPAMLST